VERREFRVEIGVLRISAANFRISAPNLTRHRSQ
jgi:hypothetical protein